MDKVKGGPDQARLNVAARSDLHRLQEKAIGLAGVLFLTLTGAAPMTAMLLNVPVAVGNGNGIGAPASFLVATAVLLVFSVGYAAMARQLTAAGGFYCFISHGLGRDLGMAMGFGSVVAYSVFEAALAGGFAFFANARIVALTGLDVPWPALALAMVALIAVLTWFDVKLSAAVLGMALVAEIVVMLIFDVAVFTHVGDGTSVRLAAINPAAAFHGFPARNGLAGGAAGIGLFFAFWSWIGFEMAPNYGEESRDPKRIVPLALYISVTLLGAFYTLTAWAAVSGYDDHAAMIAQAQTDAANFFMAPSGFLLAGWITGLMGFLILTSSFACGMAFHNTAARYLYALGREGVLPAALGRTHPAHRSPYVASLAQSGIAAAIVVLFAAIGGADDPERQAYAQLYGLMSLMGTLLILAAQAVVSLAIVAYFRRERRGQFHWGTTFAAPVAAFLAQILIIWLCVSNAGFLGGGLAFAHWLAPLDAAVIALGLLGAIRIRRRDPERYAQIGRLIYEGVPDGAMVSGEHAEEALAVRYPPRLTPTA